MPEHPTEGTPVSSSLGDIPPQPDPAALVLHVASTLLMAGLAWTAQLVIYPAIAPDDRVNTPVAKAPVDDSAIPWPVRLVMFLEMSTGFLLYVQGYGPWSFEGGTWLIFRDLLGLGLLLLALIWTSTALVQAPILGRLALQVDTADHRRLLATHWFRTIGWTVRAILGLTLLVLAWRMGAAS